LKLESELSRIRTQVEQLEGQLRFLSDRVSLATITVSLFSPGDEPPVPAETWSAGRDLKAATRSFVQAGRVVLRCVLWGVIMLPYWFIPLTVIWWLVRWGQRRLANRNEREG